MTTIEDEWQSWWSEVMPDAPPALIALKPLLRDTYYAGATAAVAVSADSKDHASGLFEILAQVTARHLQ